ncbi:ImmA/IrrE family metallo-endopeptidase [soil metagenome]
MRYTWLKRIFMSEKKPDYEKARKEAEKLLKDNSILDAPVPVNQIAENLSLELLRGSFIEAQVAGFIDLDMSLIVVNEKDSLNRQVFTIAHEIGHFVMHKERLREDASMAIMYRKPIGGEADPYEQEANAFAANLLVPEDLLAKYFEYQSFHVVARIFGVSEEVIRYRLKTTGRI